MDVVAWLAGCGTTTGEIARAIGAALYDDDALELDAIVIARGGERWCVYVHPRCDAQTEAAAVVTLAARLAGADVDARAAARRLLRRLARARAVQQAELVEH